MNLRKLQDKENFYLLLLALSFSLIAFKWIFSFISYDENIYLRIINETSDNYYYPLIKTFSDFDYNQLYVFGENNSKIISFPILSLLVNSIFLKLFGAYSFIILELFCTSIFLFIFISIFKEIGFSKHISIFLSLFIFILTELFKDISIININFINILTMNFESFYSLRFPRPLISNLFFFSFIYFTIKFLLTKDKFIKYLFYLTLLMGLSLNSFFYHFFAEVFLLVIVFIYKFQFSTFKIIIEKYKFFTLYVVLLLLFAAILQIQIYFSEEDYIERLGVFFLNFDQKEILIDYMIKFILKKEFIILFFTNSVFFYFIKNKAIKVFYFLFISTILATIFFILTFNKGVDYYHFFNLIIVSGILFLILAIIYYSNIFISNFLKENKIKYFSYLASFIVIIYFNFSHNLKVIDFKNLNDEKRNNLSEIVNFISNSEYFLDKNKKIFNLNKELAIWFIFNDYKNFSILPVSFWSPKKNELLEEELIASFKFLNLNKINFYNHIKNELKTWRFKNEFVYDYFGRKYIANSLITFKNNILDYTNIETEYIFSNNLLITHQVIIPKSEINRLLVKFDRTNKKINPDVVIIDKDDLSSNVKFNNLEYCLIFNNNQFQLFTRKNLTKECN